MNSPGIGPPLAGLLQLDRIQFLQRFDGDDQIVIVEFIEAARIVQQYIGI